MYVTAELMLSFPGAAFLFLWVGFSSSLPNRAYSIQFLFSDLACFLARGPLACRFFPLTWHFSLSYSFCRPTEKSPCAKDFPACREPLSLSRLISGPLRMWTTYTINGRNLLMLTATINRTKMTPIPSCIL